MATTSMLSCRSAIVFGSKENPVSSSKHVAHTTWPDDSRTVVDESSHIRHAGSERPECSPATKAAMARARTNSYSRSAGGMANRS